MLKCFLLLLIAANLLGPNKAFILGYPEGADCKNRGENAESGTCRLINDCPSALHDVIHYHKHTYTVCNYAGTDQIVCCPPDSAIDQRHPDNNGGDIITKNKLRKCAQKCQSYKLQSRVSINYNILNGDDADVGEFPHMAALAYYHDDDAAFKFDCGGTIISENYVLTAAHCITSARDNKLTFVRVGEVDIPLDGVDRMTETMDYGVREVIIHPKHDRKIKQNDLALLALNTSIQFTLGPIAPACLYTKNDNPKDLIVTGWGATDNMGSRKATLQKANVSSVDNGKCDQTYFKRNQRHIIDSQLCAMDQRTVENRSDACIGDSGGPIQVKISRDQRYYYVVAVTSYGMGCGGSAPAIYTRVYSYLDWIEGIVWP